MSDMTTRRSQGYVERPSSSSLVDVINVILDKGLVIDAFVRVSVVGIELITIDARIVIASVDTYLRFAEATNRLDLLETGGRDLPELAEDMSEGVTKGKSKGVLQSAKDALFSDDEKDRKGQAEDESEEPEDKRPPRQKKPQERPRRRPVREEQS